MRRFKSAPPRRRSTGRPPLRVPASPHVRGDRLVPVAGCGCETCQQARDDHATAGEVRHWGRVGELLDLAKDKKPSGSC